MKTEQNKLGGKKMELSGDLKKMERGQEPVDEKMTTEEKALNALEVIYKTSYIRAFLRKVDPMALAQVRNALVDGGRLETEKYEGVLEGEAYETAIDRVNESLKKRR